MRIVLDVPESWSIAEAAGRVAVGTTGLTLVVGGLIVLPDEQREWQMETARAGLSPAMQAVVTSSTDGETATGWPIRVCRVDVVEAGALVERRLIALYAFLEHGATVIVAGEPDRLDEHEAELRRVLGTARPSWRGEEVTALAELWNLPGT